MVYAKLKSGVTTGVRICGTTLYPARNWVKFKEHHLDALRKHRFVDVLTEVEKRQIDADTNAKFDEMRDMHWKTVEKELSTIEDTKFLLSLKGYAENEGLKTLERLANERLLRLR